MAGTDPTYVTRYCLTPSITFLMSYLAVVMSACVVIFPYTFVDQLRHSPETADIVLMVVVLGSLEGFCLFMAVGSVAWLVATARHWEALRADRQGMTLARRPMPGSRTVTVPWPDIEAVVVFSIPARKPYYFGGLAVGLRLLSGASRPPGFRDPDSVWAWPRRPPLVIPTPDGVNGFRTVQGYDLDDKALGSVIRAYAPHVQYRGRPRPEIPHLYPPAST